MSKIDELWDQFFERVDMSEFDADERGVRSRFYTVVGPLARQAELIEKLRSEEG